MRMKITGTIILAVALAAHSRVAAQSSDDSPHYASAYEISEQFGQIPGEVQEQVRLVCHTYKQSETDFNNAKAMFKKNFNLDCQPGEEAYIAGQHVQSNNQCTYVLNQSLSQDTLDQIDQWFLNSHWGWCSP